MEDSGILELYFLRNEQAIQETERKYGAYCKTIAGRILKNREDTEETVNDTCHPAPKAELFAGLPGPDHPEWGH